MDYTRAGNEPLRFSKGRLRDYSPDQRQWLSSGVIRVSWAYHCVLYLGMVPQRSKVYTKQKEHRYSIAYWCPCGSFNLLSNGAMCLCLSPSSTKVAYLHDCKFGWLLCIQLSRVGMVGEVIIAAFRPRANRSQSRGAESSSHVVRASV